jgi:hypothetical protein
MYFSQSRWTEAAIVVTMEALCFGIHTDGLKPTVMLQLDPGAKVPRQSLVSEMQPRESLLVHRTSEVALN